MGTIEIKKLINFKLKYNKIILEYQHVTTIQNQALEKSRMFRARN